MQDFETSIEETPIFDSKYQEEVVTREYAAVLGVNEGVADLLNYINDLATKNGIERPEIQEIKEAVKAGDTYRVKELLEGVEAGIS